MGLESIMIPASLAGCVCSKYPDNLPTCDGPYGLKEQGKKVRLVPKAGEQAWALVLDGCVFQDSQIKCDGALIWSNKSRTVVCLVELKGAGDIAHAFAQLAFVWHKRPAFHQLLADLERQGGVKPVVKAFVVTNGLLSRPEKERLEKHHGVRVQEVLHCEASTPIPDLRSRILN